LIQTMSHILFYSLHLCIPFPSSTSLSYFSSYSSHTPLWSHCFTSNCRCCSSCARCLLTNRLSLLSKSSICLLTSKPRLSPSLFYQYAIRSPWSQTLLAHHLDQLRTSTCCHNWYAISLLANYEPTPHISFRN
jgi:hypothetical protein